MSNVVLYDIACAWEVDFITSDILKNQQENFVFRFLNTKDFLEYSDTSHTNVILVFTSNLVSFEEIKKLTLRLKPQVIIHLSDEWGTKPEFVELSAFTKVVLRQHWFPKVYEPRANIFQIPLGYMTNFPKNIVITPIAKRDLTWSFLGQINAPRRKMIECLKEQLQIGKHFVGNGLSVKDMAGYYQRSIFVPNERGAVRLDTFRIYEAIKCGAIPVIVGDDAELRETFTFEGPLLDFPSWVSANSWDKAIAKCKILLLQENCENLQHMQLTNLQWFQKHIELAQRRILHALSFENKA